MSPPMSKSPSLFGHTVLLSRGVWEQTLVVSSASVVPVLSEATIRVLLTELHRPKLPDDTHAHAANRREAKLREVFATLSSHESLALQRRLEIEAPADELAIAFRRLIPERRARLLAHLAALRHRRL
jgi:hypothetical protein